MHNIRLHNLREGHACNSSSSHSIFIWPGVLPNGVSAGGQHFGWENFTLRHRSTKLSYLAQQLYATLWQEIGEEYAKVLIEGLLSGVDIDSEGYVDHQSILTFPREWRRHDGIDTEFVQELIEFFARGDTVVFGGNDNSEVRFPEAVPAEAYKVPFVVDSPLAERKAFLARKDGNYWTLFNRKTGVKVRLTLNDPSEPYKAARPELVDIKLTDNCPFNCAYCYQGSTADRPGIDYSKVIKVAAVLADWKVFEVAMGGGEITLDPAFKACVEHFYELGITPNLTTRSLAWLHNPELREPILAQVGAVAFSVNQPLEVAKLAEVLARYRLNPEQFTVQYVMGSTPTREFAWLFSSLLRECKAARLRLTLLGYKTTGRGSEFVPGTYSNWPALVRENARNCPQLSIDTALAAQTNLVELGIPAWSYHVLEGKTSMYIDVPGSKAAASSYADIMLPLNFDYQHPQPLSQQLEAAWKTF